MGKRKFNAKGRQVVNTLIDDSETKKVRFYLRLQREVDLRCLVKVWKCLFAIFRSNWILAGRKMQLIMVATMRPTRLYCHPKSVIRRSRRQSKPMLPGFYRRNSARIWRKLSTKRRKSKKYVRRKIANVPLYRIAHYSSAPGCLRNWPVFNFRRQISRK